MNASAHVCPACIYVSYVFSQKCSVQFSEKWTRLIGILNRNVSSECGI